MFFWDVSSCEDVTHITLAFAIEISDFLCCCECVELFGSDVSELTDFFGSALVGFNLISQEVEDLEQ